MSIPTPKRVYLTAIDRDQWACPLPKELLKQAGFQGDEEVELELAEDMETHQQVMIIRKVAQG